MTDLSETSRKLWDLWNAKKPLPGVGGQMVGLERYRLDANGMQFEALCEASDEIERLRAQLAAVERERDEAKVEVARITKTEREAVKDLAAALNECDAALAAKEQAERETGIIERYDAKVGALDMMISDGILNYGNALNRAEQAETALAGAVAALEAFVAKKPDAETLANGHPPVREDQRTGS